MPTPTNWYRIQFEQLPNQTQAEIAALLLALKLNAAEASKARQPPQGLAGRRTRVWARKIIPEISIATKQQAQTSLCSSCSPEIRSRRCL